MPFDIPDEYANWTVTVTNASGGNSAKNSFALATHCNASLGATEVARIANLFRDALTPLLDNSWTIGPVKVVVNQGGSLQTVEDTGTEAGTHAAQAYASPAIAHVVKKQTGLVGKEFRGRIYWPAVPEADVDESGALSGTQVNAVTAAFEDLRSDLIADAAIDRVVLLHDLLSDIPSTEPTTIIALTCGTIVGTMRPRQRRR